MPDLDLHTADGPAHPVARRAAVLLNLGEPGGFDRAPRANRIRFVDARHGGAWELSLIGEVAAAAAVLIRPYGYIACAGDSRLPSCLGRSRPGSEPRYFAR